MKRIGATPLSANPHFAISETPAYVGRAVAALAADPHVSWWNGQSLSAGQLAKIYGFTDLEGSQPDAWRYLVEVQDAGKLSDVTGCASVFRAAANLGHGTMNSVGILKAFSAKCFEQRSWQHR